MARKRVRDDDEDLEEDFEEEIEDESDGSEDSEEEYDDDENDDDDEEDEDEEEEEARNAPVYNVGGLMSSLRSLRARGASARGERMKLVRTTACPAIDDAEDDLRRELALHDQALGTARDVLGTLRAEGERVTRPTDFYAEMVKTDAHMRRVRGRLLLEQQRRTFADERRKLAQQKKYAKEVQAEKLKERSREKKQMEKNVREWQNKRKASGYAGDGGEFPVSLGGDGDDVGGDDIDPGLGQRAQRLSAAMSGKAGSKSHAGDTRGSKQAVSKKQHLKNKKFGSGGQKKLRKQNDGFSAADMSDCKAGKRPGFVNKNGGKGGAARRPGKRRREQARK